MDFEQRVVQHRADHLAALGERRDQFGFAFGGSGPSQDLVEDHVDGSVNCDFALD